MYTQVWMKFLPVIRLMLKRSVTDNQVVKMNRTDFDKAGGGKKAGFSFTLEFRNGKVYNRFTSQLAKDLVSVLLADEGVRVIMLTNDFILEMNPKCELSMRMIPETTAISS